MKIRKYIRHLGLHLRYRFLTRSLSVKNDNQVGKIDVQNLQGKLPLRQHSKMLIFAASDSHYFDRYGYSFIESILQNTYEISIHIHLYNPLEEQLEFLEKLNRPCEESELSYSWESIDLKELGEEAKGRFFYSMRFVRMAEIFESSKMNCLCLDIDSLIVRKLDHLYELLNNVDIAFYARFNKVASSTKLLAGTLYLRYESYTQAFLAKISKQLKKFIIKGYLLEKLDQLVIYDNFKQLSRANPQLKFLPFDQSIIDIKFTNDGLVWYPKGQSKNQKEYQDKLKEYKLAMEKRVASDSTYI